MKKNTAQQKFWKSDFGVEYTERNTYNPLELDEFYKKNLGIARSQMNNEFIGGLKIDNILEVGCNVGNQLRMLQNQNYNNLYGIEILEYAVEKAKKISKGINIIQGSAFDIPFQDNYFDLVFTAGVLIHISPNDIKEILREIYRVSKKYILGYEYYSDDYKTIEYRGNKDRLWKTNFVQIYLDAFPDLKLLKEEKYKYLDNENVDSMFLLVKDI